MATSVLAPRGLNALIQQLTADGYRVIGPRIRDGAIVYDDLESTADLPSGWTDTHGGGSYRLERRRDEALFGYNLGPTGWKRFLNAPKVNLFSVNMTEDGVSFVAADHDPPRQALFGVRPCELAAIAIQDTVFTESGQVDASYASRRAATFIVAVECGEAGATCFCASMDSGPGTDSGYDIRLTEIPIGDGFEYLVDCGSAAGEALVANVPTRPANDSDLSARRGILAEAKNSMGKTMDTDGIRDLLVEGYDHPRWEDVAARCLTCGNCTMACPTCFCSTMVDHTSLNGTAYRTRVWDSCFSLDFSAIHRHPVRSTAKSRYRQWMTHKLATWHDQFGSSGCVGCGRCITWCPVGIDITAEVRAIREEALV